MKFTTQIAVLLVALPLVGCRDYSVSLRGGYSFVRTDGANRSIVNKESGVVVYPDVASYEEINKFIVGCRQKSRLPLSEKPEFTTGFGYFILDTETGKYSGGLSAAAFSNERELLGLPETVPHASCP